MIRPVLLLGTEPRIALPIARSLNRRGIPVWIAGIKDAYRLRSRAVQGFICLPDSATGEFATVLLEHIDKHGFEMLIPISDSALVAIARCYEKIKDRIHVACPPPETLNLVIDKQHTLDIAASIGIPVPQTYAIPDMSELEKIESSLKFPLIAKPSSKRKSAGFKILYFGDIAELRSGFRKDPYLGLKAMFQEYCYGVGLGIELLIHDGKPVVAFQHRRIRELPGTGGVSVLAVAEKPDPNLLQLSVRLLNEMKWEGVAMVEFRYDPTHKRAILMEINGRYWGSIATPLWAGVDFHYYEWQIAHRQTPSVPDHFREGIRARWFTGDLLRLHGQFTGPRDRFQPTSLPKEVVHFAVDSRPPIHDMVFTWSDPVPAVLEGFHFIKETAVLDVKAAIRKIVPESAMDKALFYRRLGWGNAFRYFSFRAQNTVGVRRRRLPQLLQHARSVLFLCYGNIMRSHLAAALLENRLPANLRDKIAIESAGLLQDRDGRSEHRAIAVAREHGLSLDNHRSRGVTEAMLRAADVIFVMDYANHANLLAKHPQVGRKTFLFGELKDGNEPIEIVDPYEGSIEDVSACFNQLLVCTDNLVKLIRDSESVRPSLREPNLPAGQVPRQREAQ